MDIPLPTGAYEARSKNINAQMLQNWYAIFDQAEGSKKKISLVGTPGLTTRATLSAGSGVRGLYPIGDELFGVCGSGLYQVETDWSVSASLGTLDTDTGYVTMDDDGTYLFVTDGTSAYTFHTGTDTFAKVTDVDLIGAGSGTFQDGFFFVHNGQTMQKSALNNPTAWSALDIGIESGQSDDLVRVISNNRNLWAMGARTIVPWYNTGVGDFPYARVPGAFIESGLAGIGGVCRALDTLFLLNDKREVVRMDGFRSVTVSTPSIHYQLGQLSAVADVVSYSYSEEGNTMIVFSFPSANKTFVYNATTTRWHTWSSFITTSGVTTYNNRHRGACFAKFNGFHLVGDHTNGKIYSMSQDVYKDDSDLVRRIAGFPTIQNTDTNKDIQMFNFIAEFEHGVGLDGTTQGTDPQAMLRISYDNGHTYGYEQWRDIGQIGERGIEARWNKLGAAHSFTPELVMTDPVKPVIVGAYGDVRGLNR